MDRTAERELGEASPWLPCPVHGVQGHEVRAGLEVIVRSVGTFVSLPFSAGKHSFLRGL